MKKRIPDYIFSIFLTLLMAIVFLYLCSLNSYAFEHGWTVIDSTQYTSTDLAEWYDDKNPIFPAFLTGFEPVDKDSISYKDFPRWITTDLIVYKFKTGWVKIHPGTDDSTVGNGFVLLNKDRNEMTVYHLWGE